MGLRPEYLQFIEDCIEVTIGSDQHSGRLRMLELGDQLVSADGIREKTGKEYFENRGFEHTSFDLNASHGALPIDLSRPIRDSRYLNAFHVVTNSGTSEHVEPFRAQPQVFANMHECMRRGGISIHLVPDLHELEVSGAWKNHCNNYYTESFFSVLAELNNYDLVESKVIFGLRCVCVRKRSSQPFTSDVEAILSAIGRKQGGIEYPGINSSKWRKLVVPPLTSLRRRARSQLDGIGRKMRGG